MPCSEFSLEVGDYVVVTSSKKESNRFVGKITTVIPLISKKHYNIVVKYPVTARGEQITVDNTQKNSIIKLGNSEFFKVLFD